MKKHVTIISNAIVNQQKFLELLILAVILAFGINLIANQFPILFHIDPFHIILIGIFLCLLSIVFLIKQILDNRRLVQEYIAFFIYGEKNNLIIDIPEYWFSGQMVRSLNAVFVENINTKKFWDTKPLSRSIIYDEEKVSSRRNVIKLI
jgi:hypothetical protein